MIKAFVFGVLINIPSSLVPVYDPDFLSLDCEEYGTWVAYDWADDAQALELGYPR